MDLRQLACLWWELVVWWGWAKASQWGLGGSCCPWKWTRPLHWPSFWPTWSFMSGAYREECRSVGSFVLLPSFAVLNTVWSVWQSNLLANAVSWSKPPFIDPAPGLQVTLGMHQAAQACSPSGLEGWPQRLWKLFFFPCAAGAGRLCYWLLPSHPAFGQLGVWASPGSCCLSAGLYAIHRNLCTQIHANFCVVSPAFSISDAVLKDVAFLLPGLLARG